MYVDGGSHGASQGFWPQAERYQLTCYRPLLLFARRPLLLLPNTTTLGMRYAEASKSVNYALISVEIWQKWEEHVRYQQRCAHYYSSLQAHYYYDTK